MLYREPPFPPWLHVGAWVRLRPNPECPGRLTPTGRRIAHHPRELGLTARVLRIGWIAEDGHDVVAETEPLAYPGYPRPFDEAQSRVLTFAVVEVEPAESPAP